MYYLCNIPRNKVQSMKNLCWNYVSKLISVSLKLYFLASLTISSQLKVKDHFDSPHISYATLALI